MQGPVRCATSCLLEHCSLYIVLDVPGALLMSLLFCQKSPVGDSKAVVLFVGFLG